MSHSIQPTFRFDSSDYPERKSFETWREVISATHDVAPSSATPLRFQVRCTLWYLGQMMITSGQLSAQTFVRDQQRIRLDQLDQYGLFAQGQGQRVGNTGDDEYISRPGDLQVFDLAQFDTSSPSDGNGGTLYLPRDLVDEVIPDFSRFHGVVLRDGASRLLAQHILAMGHYLESMPGDTLPGVTRATMEMALGCLVGATAGHPGVGAPYESALRRQVERYVDANLGDPELAIESICSAFAISRSTLYRLFDAHSGVANFVKARRLARIRSILIANEDTRSLSDIAEDFGFSSGGHFSREFHKQFGFSPSEIRANRAAPSIADQTVETPLDTIFRMLHP